VKRYQSRIFIVYMRRTQAGVYFYYGSYEEDARDAEMTASILKCADCRKVALDSGMQPAEARTPVFSLRVICK